MAELRLPDILARDLKVIFCGINPAPSAAVAGHHFVSPSNRFWRVLHQSGLTPIQIQPADDHTILAYGYGLTAAVDRPTRGAAELKRAEFAESAATLQRKIRRWAPRAIAFLGKSAYLGMTESQSPVLTPPCASRLFRASQRPHRSGSARRLGMTICFR